MAVLPTVEGGTWEPLDYGWNRYLLEAVVVHEAPWQNLLCLPRTWTAAFQRVVGFTRGQHTNPLDFVCPEIRRKPRWTRSHVLCEGGTEVVDMEVSQDSLQRFSAQATEQHFRSLYTKACRPQNIAGLVFVAACKGIKGFLLSMGLLGGDRPDAGADREGAAWAAGMAQWALGELLDFAPLMFPVLAIFVFMPGRLPRNLVDSRAFFTAALVAQIIMVVAITLGEGITRHWCHDLTFAVVLSHGYRMAFLPMLFSDELVSLMLVLLATYAMRSMADGIAVALGALVIWALWRCTTAAEWSLSTQLTFLMAAIIPFVITELHRVVSCNPLWSVALLSGCYLLLASMLLGRFALEKDARAKYVDALESGQIVVDGETHPELVKQLSTLQQQRRQQREAKPKAAPAVPPPVLPLLPPPLVGGGEDEAAAAAAAAAVAAAGLQMGGQGAMELVSLIPAALLCPQEEMVCFRMCDATPAALPQDFRKSLTSAAVAVGTPLHVFSGNLSQGSTRLVVNMMQVGGVGTDWQRVLKRMRMDEDMQGMTRGRLTVQCGSELLEFNSGEMTQQQVVNTPVLDDVFPSVLRSGVDDQVLLHISNVRTDAQNSDASVLVMCNHSTRKIPLPMGMRCSERSLLNLRLKCAPGSKATLAWLAIAQGGAVSQLSPLLVVEGAALADEFGELVSRSPPTPQGVVPGTLPLGVCKKMMSVFGRLCELQQLLSMGRWELGEGGGVRWQPNNMRLQPVVESYCDALRATAPACLYLAVLHGKPAIADLILEVLPLLFLCSVSAADETGAAPHPTEEVLLPLREAPVAIHELSAPGLRWQKKQQLLQLQQPPEWAAELLELQGGEELARTAFRTAVRLACTSAGPHQSTLLHAAMASCSPQTLTVLEARARQFGLEFNWAIRGPGGRNPLHMAPDTPAGRAQLHRAISSCCGAAAAWLEEARRSELKAADGHVAAALTDAALHMEEAEARLRAGPSMFSLAGVGAVLTGFDDTKLEQQYGQRICHFLKLHSQGVALIWLLMAGVEGHAMWKQPGCSPGWLLVNTLQKFLMIAYAVTMGFGGTQRQRRGWDIEGFNLVMQVLMVALMDLVTIPTHWLPCLIPGPHSRQHLATGCMHYITMPLFYPMRMCMQKWAFLLIFAVHGLGWVLVDIIQQEADLLQMLSFAGLSIAFVGGLMALLDLLARASFVRAARTQQAAGKAKV